MSSTNRRIAAPEFIDTGFVYSDQTRAEAAEIIARYPQSRSALLPLLHLVQSVEGCITKPGIALCAELLGLETAEVSAVATFYTMYKRKPCGQHLVSVCTNTLCAALGGDAIYRTLSDYLGVGHEETAGTPGQSGSITLESAECLAGCDHAPVVHVNYEYFDNQTPDTAMQLVQSLQRGDKPHPDRGAPLTDFRTAEREIAGLFGDLETSVEGATNSPESLRGNTIAAADGDQTPARPKVVAYPETADKKQGA